MVSAPPLVPCPPHCLQRVAGPVLPGGGRRAAGSLGRELAGRSGRPSLTPVLAVAVTCAPPPAVTRPLLFQCSSVASFRVDAMRLPSAW